MHERKNYQEVLAIDPMISGFAFAVLEQGGRLVDWGRKKTSSIDRNARCADGVTALIRTYRPDALVLEDCAGEGSRRCARVRALIRKLHTVASSESIPVESIPPRFLREICTGNSRATKHDVARTLATRLPELARHVPPVRKPWMTEDPRMSIFDAVALAVSVFHRTERRYATRGRP